MTFAVDRCEVLALAAAKVAGYAVIDLCGTGTVADVAHVGGAENLTADTIPSRRHFGSFGGPHQQCDTERTKSHRYSNQLTLLAMSTKVHMS